MYEKYIDIIDWAKIAHVDHYYSSWYELHAPSILLTDKDLQRFSIYYRFLPHKFKIITITVGIPFTMTIYAPDEYE